MLFVFWYASAPKQMMLALLHDSLQTIASSTLAKTSGCANATLAYYVFPYHSVSHLLMSSVCYAQQENRSR